MESSGGEVSATSFEGSPGAFVDAAEAALPKRPAMAVDGVRSRMRLKCGHVWGKFVVGLVCGRQYVKAEGRETFAADAPL